MSRRNMNIEIAFLQNQRRIEFYIKLQPKYDVPVLENEVETGRFQAN
jgi:hypothetical protein